MYPFFTIPGTEIPVYLFGIFLVVSFLMFVWMLRKLSRKVGISFSFFTNRAVLYVLSIVFFSRLFYIFSVWNEMKYMSGALDFFVMDDYNFSLFGAIFGFLLVLFLTLKRNKMQIDKYIDITVISFLFAATVGYIGAFMGGQVYGEPTNLGIEISTSPLSTIPYDIPIFPLGIVYAIACFLLFSLSYILFTVVPTRGIVGTLSFVAYFAIAISLETLSGKNDIVAARFENLNMNQIIAMCFIVVLLILLVRLIIKKPSKNETLRNRETA